MYRFKILFISIAIGSAVAGIVFAWTSPSGNPTTGGGALYYSGGNVGIGTATPGAKLDVAGGARISQLLDLSGINYIHKISGHNFVQGDATMTYFYGGSGGVQIRKSDNSVSLVQVLDNGNVGIGTTNPSQALEFGANKWLSFEGATDNGFETTIQVIDPTADRTVIIPNTNSVTLPSGAIFFMITGSCPPGTTDVSVALMGRFVRIDSLAGQTGGSNTHTHGAGSYVTANGHTHTLAVGNNGGDLSDGVQSDGTYMQNEGQDTYSGNTVKITTEPGGLVGIAGTSSTGDNIPMYVKVKCCQVN